MHQSVHPPLNPFIHRLANPSMQPSNALNTCLMDFIAYFLSAARTELMEVFLTSPAFKQHKKTNWCHSIRWTEWQLSLRSQRLPYFSVYALFTKQLNSTPLSPFFLVCHRKRDNYFCWRHSSCWWQHPFKPTSSRGNQNTSGRNVTSRDSATRVQRSRNVQFWEARVGGLVFLDCSSHFSVPCGSAIFLFHCGVVGSALVVLFWWRGG